MTPKERKYKACKIAIEAWFNYASPSKAIQDAFDDDDMIATEEEILCGLEAVRLFRKSTGASSDRVAANCAGL